MDVFDDGASQVERTKFVGRTGVQNGLFWCVHNEELLNAALIFLIFASYIFRTTGIIFLMKLVLKILLNVVETSTFRGFETGQK